MFGNKKNRRVINSLFKMYKIFHEAISSAHMEGVYTGKEYNRMHETYSGNMLSVARAVSGEEGVFQLSMLCSQFHDENVKNLDKELEGMKERGAGKREEEKVSDVEEKYDGYVTTVTKSPVYSDRWQPTLSEQPWRPAIGEAGWHTREGEMGSRGQEKPAVKYIYNIELTRDKDEPAEIARDRDKLIEALKNRGFEVFIFNGRTLSVHTEDRSSKFGDLVNLVYRESGIESEYDMTYRGKMVPVVRYEED